MDVLQALTALAIIAAGVVAVILVARVSKGLPDRQLAPIFDRQLNALAVIDDFNPAVRIDCLPDGYGIALDPGSARLALTHMDEVKIFDFSQIIAAEIVKDGGTLTSTNRGSQVAGAAVGAVLLGPMGMLMGGVTGSKRTVPQISKLSLKIYTNDLVRPVYELVFLQTYNRPIPVSAAESILRNADDWYARLRTIIHMNGT